MTHFIHGQRYPIQPDQAGKVNGVIRSWPHPEWEDRYIFAAQCQDCGLVEVVVSLVLTQILFNPSHEDGRRRCFECRLARMTAQYPDCPCSNCADLRREARR